MAQCLYNHPELWCPLPSRTFLSPKTAPTLHLPPVVILLTQQYHPCLSIFRLILKIAMKIILRSSSRSPCPLKVLYHKQAPEVSIVQVLAHLKPWCPSDSFCVLKPYPSLLWKFWASSSLWSRSKCPITAWCIMLTERGLELYLRGI